MEGGPIPQTPPKWTLSRMIKPQSAQYAEAMRHRSRQGRRVTRLGMWVNGTLALAKAVGGILGGSQALLADALHSLSDLASDLIVLFALRFSGEPADRRHPAAQSAGAVPADSGQASFPGGPREDRSSGGQTGSLLRLQRGAVLHHGRRTRRCRPAPVRRLPATRAETWRTLTQVSRVEPAIREQPLGCWLHQCLPGSLSVP